MWKPVLDGPLADGEIRKHYQVWSFYYPTGQPVPFSALQLRQALTDAASRHRLRKPLVLIGHSMGGVVARAQVSRISAAEAEEVMPEIGVDYPLIVKLGMPSFLNQGRMLNGSYS